MADPPRKPKQKAATVIVFFLVAAAALFTAIAAFGIYTRGSFSGYRFWPVPGEATSHGAGG